MRSTLVRVKCGVVALIGFCCLKRSIIDSQMRVLLCPSQCSIVKCHMHDAFCFCHAKRIPKYLLLKETSKRREKSFFYGISIEQSRNKEDRENIILRCLPLDKGDYSPAFFENYSWLNPCEFGLKMVTSGKVKI